MSGRRQGKVMTGEEEGWMMCRRTGKRKRNQSRETTRGNQRLPGSVGKGKEAHRAHFENFVIVWKVLFATFKLFQGKGFVTEHFPLV